VSDSNGNGNGNGRGVTYSEVRRMARWLNAFTARELADALHAHEAVGERFVRALRWQGICEDTGATIEGPSGPEQLYEMEPLPDWNEPRIRRVPPEIQAVYEMFGGLLLFDLRGLPVRIRTERAQRRSLSTPGARQVHKNREREYHRQKEARERAARQAERKRIAKSQGRQYVPTED
jgi:hypothetical protein